MTENKPPAIDLFDSIACANLSPSLRRAKRTTRHRIVVPFTSAYLELNRETVTTFTKSNCFSSRHLTGAAGLGAAVGERVRAFVRPDLPEHLLDCGPQRFPGADGGAAKQSPELDGGLLD